MAVESEEYQVRFQRISEANLRNSAEVFLQGIVVKEEDRAVFARWLYDLKEQIIPTIGRYVSKERAINPLFFQEDEWIVADVIVSNKHELEPLVDYLLKEISKDNSGLKEQVRQTRPKEGSTDMRKADKIRLLDLIVNVCARVDLLKTQQNLENIVSLEDLAVRIEGLISSHDLDIRFLRLFSQGLDMFTNLKFLNTHIKVLIIVLKIQESRTGKT